MEREGERKIPWKYNRESVTFRGKSKTEKRTNREREKIKERVL